MTPTDIAVSRYSQTSTRWTRPDLEKIVLLLMEGKSRAVVADEMSVIMGRPITKNMIISAVEKLRGHGAEIRSGKGARLRLVESGLVFSMPTLKRFPKAADHGSGQYKTVADIPRRGCRYPTKNGPEEAGENDWGFCGERQKDGSSYCEKHHALCYRGRAKIPKAVLKLAEKFR